MLRSFEHKLIFKPTRFPRGNWNPGNLTFEDVQFSSDDGVALHGWFCPSPHPPSAAFGGARPVLVYFHGNRGNISDRAPSVREWQEAFGVDVFIFDYRGYGKSKGRPFEAGLYRDSRAAYRWLTEVRGVPPEQTIFLGRSLGGGVATELAVSVPQRCLILESTFTSLPDVGARIYPWLPVRRWMKTAFDSRSRIQSYHRPVMIIHGKADPLIPISHARELYRLANEPKGIFEVDDALHNDAFTLGGEPLIHILEDFFRNAFAIPQQLSAAGT